MSNRDKKWICCADRHIAGVYTVSSFAFHVTKLPRTSKRQRQTRVDALLDQFSPRAKDMRIGSATIKVSGWRKRRLSMACSSHGCASSFCRYMTSSLVAMPAVMHILGLSYRGHHPHHNSLYVTFESKLKISFFF